MARLYPPPEPIPRLVLNDDENLIETDQQQTEKTPEHENIDLLEQELAYLHQVMDEVNTLVARQQELQDRIRSRTARIDLWQRTQESIENLSAILHSAVRNRYVSAASGALVGASIGGPFGFLMGAKIGALATLSGSTVGALSMQIFQQNRTPTIEDKPQNLPVAYNQAML